LAGGKQLVATKRRPAVWLVLSEFPTAERSTPWRRRAEHSAMQRRSPVATTCASTTYALLVRQLQANGNQSGFSKASSLKWQAGLATVLARWTGNSLTATLTTGLNYHPRHRGMHWGNRAPATPVVRS